jgi:hypothetical protein
MPRAAKKKASNAPTSTPIAKESTRDQSKAINLTDGTGDDESTSATPTPGMKSRPRLTLSQPNPPSSQPRPRGSKPKVTGEQSSNEPENAPGPLNLVPESDDEVQIEAQASEDAPNTDDQVAKEREEFYYSVFKKVYYDAEKIYENTIMSANVGDNQFDYAATYGIAIAKAKAKAKTLESIRHAFS